jgi:nucleolar complex protein 2
MGSFCQGTYEGLQEDGVHYLMDVLVQVSKPVLKTRTFQEDCVSGVVEQLTEHLAQNSYSVAFPELAVVPLVQLRRLIKDITVDRFRKQFKVLVEQVIPTL